MSPADDKSDVVIVTWWWYETSNARIKPVFKWKK